MKRFFKGFWVTEKFTIFPAPDKLEPAQEQVAKATLEDATIVALLRSLALTETPQGKA